MPTEVLSRVQIRSGTEAELLAMPVGQKLLSAELGWTTDTHKLYAGVDVDTDPVLVTAGAFIDESQEGSERSYRGGVLTQNNGTPLTGLPSTCLDVQYNRSSSAHRVAAGNGIAYGSAITIASSGLSAIGIGRSITCNNSSSIGFGVSVTLGATGAIGLGSTLTNNVANTIMVGHNGAVMRGDSTNSGWIESLLASASARTASGVAVSDSPVGTLPTGYFGFRLNGNDLWVDANIGGTVRSRNLGTLA
jgi:hypothetical protein